MARRRRRRSRKVGTNDPQRKEDTHKERDKTNHLSSDHVTTTPEHGHLIDSKANEEILSDTKKTTIVSCIQIHDLLDFMRDAAEFTENVGPVVLIAGEKREGLRKQILVQGLINHAVSGGRTPVLVNLNVSEGFFPQTMGLCTVKRDDEDKSASLEEAKLYFYGSKDPKASPSLFLNLMKQLSEEMSCKFRENNEIRSSGAIINTCGWVARCGHRYLRSIVNIMKATVVIVVGDEELHDRLLGHISRVIQTFFVPNPEKGATNKQTKISAQQERVRNYFHQPSVQNNTGTPFSFDVPFSELDIYRNKEDKLDELTNVTKVEELTRLQLVALLAGPVSKEGILGREVKEFICIENIDVSTSTVTLLSRKPPPLSKKLTLIATNLQYVP